MVNLLTEPLISIIIPVLNGDIFLERCFNTLEKQEYLNLEIIFVDNGSTDGSINKISEYCSKKKNHFFLNCTKVGPGAARNEGIKFAKGEYISFLDVDDEIEPDKHIVLLEEFRGCPQASMAIGQTKIRYSDGRKSSINLGQLQIGLNIPPVPGFLWIKQFQHSPHPTALLVKNNILKNCSIRITSWH